MKKFVAAGTAVLLAAGLSLVAGVGPASAHTPSHKVDCEAVSVSLKSYQPIVPGTPAIDAVIGQDAIAPTYEDQANPAYVAAWTEPVNHDAVTHTEYKFQHRFLSFLVKWSTDANWNAESNPNSNGFTATGETRQIEDAAAWTEYVEHGAIGEPTISVMTDPGQEAITAVEAVPAVPEKANTVVVTVDGVEVENTTFGGTFTKVYPFADKYVAHDWSIDVVAYDNAKYNYSKSGTTTPCERETIPGIVGGTITDSCGVADLTLTNESDDSNDTQQATYSATIWVDGKFSEAVAVFEGDSVSRHFEFAEDSGTHNIKVLDFDGKVILEADVESDCILPQPADVVVTSEWVAGEYECDATEVEQSRTVSTTPFILVDGIWVEGETTEVTETETRELTDEEKADNVCPTPVVPEEPATPAAVKTPSVPAAAALAFTGDELLKGALLALSLLVSGAGALVVRKFSRS